MQAENTGLGGKRFLQSFEHPARRGPSPLTPKDIHAVRPKTASSLRDKLKGYADAKVGIPCGRRGGRGYPDVGVPEAVGTGLHINRPVMRCMWF